MHRTISFPRRLSRGLTAAAVALGLAPCASAQTSPALDLKQAFEAAWARQPEALALPSRRAAHDAQLRAARAWSPEPPALELALKSDRLAHDHGARELEVAVALPLWLPGERGRSQDLAQAELQALDSRRRLLQLELAARLRTLWWDWQRSRIEAEVAQDQLDHARRLAEDVARRTAAGELARADRHQADGAVAAAEALQAQTQADESAARQRLRALIGAEPRPSATAAPMPAEPAAETVPRTAVEPEAGASPGDRPRHAALAELEDRAAAAERSADLAATQTRANPELVLAATRERGTFGETYEQSLTLGIRLPFGAGARQDSRVAAARADADEARARLVYEREQLDAEREAAQRRVEATRTQLVAAERRAELARESRGFFQRSFQLGESDLPTRLRIEAEAVEAERQAARSRIELAAAISGWRQALGLLPE